MSDQAKAKASAKRRDPLDAGDPRLEGARLRYCSDAETGGEGASEIEIYERGDGAIVVAARVRREAAGLPDARFDVVAPDLETALDALDRFDPTADWSEPESLAARTGASRLQSVVAMKLALAALGEEHRRIVDRCISLWGSTPAGAGAPDPAAARLAIRSPPGA